MPFDYLLQQRRVAEQVDDIVARVAQFAKVHALRVGWHVHEDPNCYKPCNRFRCTLLVYPRDEERKPGECDVHACPECESETRLKWWDTGFGRTKEEAQAKLGFRFLTAVRAQEGLEAVDDDWQLRDEISRTIAASDDCPQKLAEKILQIVDEYGYVGRGQ